VPLSPPALIERLRGDFRQLPPDLSASLLMLTALVIFTLTGVMIRAAAQELHVLQIVFVRQVMAMFVMAPLFWIHRHQILHPAGLRLHGFRGLAAVVSMICGNAAVVFIPFADATAIQMSEVLFITALAAMFLGEKVGWRRWSATAVGFSGVVVMLQPTSGSVEVFALVALLGSAAGAIAVITLRLGSRMDSAETVIFYQGIVVLVCTAPMAWWVWVPLTPRATLILVAMAFALSAGTWLFTTAFRTGRASAIAPLQYVRLLLMALVGYWLYDETPSLPTVIGAALIVGAATYTLRRNAVRAVEKHDPAVPR